MLPKTTTRVEEHTPPGVNNSIWRETELSISRYAGAGPELIEARLDQLDREWDIERALETGAAAVSLLGLALGRFAHRRFYVLPTIAAGFLLQHALQGWCPPVSALRRLGVRTASEIEWERTSLKAARGDFLGMCRAEMAQGQERTQALSGLSQGARLGDEAIRRIPVDQPSAYAGAAI